MEISALVEVGLNRSFIYKLFSPPFSGSVALTSQKREDLGFGTFDTGSPCSGSIPD